jgi:hypothetical protein
MYELVSFYGIGAYPRFNRDHGLTVMPERNG